MNYKIIKKSEYEYLKRMRMAQGNSISILDDELNHKTAENVMLHVEIAKAREDVRKISDELNEVKAQLLETQRSQIAYQAANTRLRSDLSKYVDRNTAQAAQLEEYRRLYGVLV